MGFTVIFYKTASGICPVQDFLEHLDVKMNAKMISMLEILEDKGNLLREPYSKYLGNGIFELRCKFGSDITRALYFFYLNGEIIVTNAFIKKTQKTPKKELITALLRKRDYIQRREHL